jgi:GMP synthase (glutamine-hydrolysing)
MILLINICQEKLHFNEFVKPIGDILIRNNILGFIRHYSCLTKKDLEKADKIIICGTSLMDNSYLENLDKFNWIKNLDKPILGICAGMQIIGLVFDGRIKEKTEIGYYHETFGEEFLGLIGKQEVYHLHNNFVAFNEEFKTFTDNNLTQAIKHSEKQIYGVLFHPEVRQKDLIKNFCLL